MSKYVLGGLAVGLASMAALGPAGILLPLAATAAAKSYAKKKEREYDEVLREIDRREGR